MTLPMGLSLVLLCLLSGFQSVGAQRSPAFPGLQGSGADTVGGGRGRILRVTSLEDHGAGTLRAACETSGPRFVEFAVAGEISLQTPIYITEPHLTIDGESAPGLITISSRDAVLDHAPFGLTTHDVIIRYINFAKGFNERFRRGQGPGNFALWDKASNIVIDHCSFLWTHGKPI
ncbi:MAG: hypothetical protein AAGJ31_13325, partial [Verrucomicrobiota bacterium]